MTPVCLSPDLIFDGETLRTGFVTFVNGTVSAICNAPPAGTQTRRVAGTLTPGFLDLQVNGGDGVLLNNSPTVEGIARIAAAHRRFGTVGILPTLITDAPEVLDHAASATLTALGRYGILGLHMEGPHLSLARRGTHSARYLRPMDQRTISVVEHLCAALVPVMITVAPEAVVPGQIAHLVKTGAIVSIGHSDATAEQVRACLDEGANCFTHLYNAMSPMLNRMPGVTGACINSLAYSGIICDGIHVADEMVGLALRARPLDDTTFLVSDAMPTVGGPDHFSLYGNEIRLVDGRLINSEGSLAGAHVTMAESVVRLINVLKIDPARALRMATTIPARVIGRPTGLIGQRLENLLLLDSNWSVTTVGLSLA